jgi:phage tail sheath protein FI
MTTISYIAAFLVLLGGVTGLARFLTNAEGSQLNQQGINALRTLPTAENVVWGARVLTDDAEWRSVPVRVSVEDFMHGVWQKGALQGNTPAKAFFVKCDRQTTTQEDIANGVFTILFGFAPLKPAEFLPLTIHSVLPATPRARQNSSQFSLSTSIFGVCHDHADWRRQHRPKNNAGRQLSVHCC